MIHPYNLVSLTESCLNPDTKWHEVPKWSEQKKVCNLNLSLAHLAGGQTPAGDLGRNGGNHGNLESSRWISPTSRWISPTAKCLRGFTWIPWFHAVITYWKGPRDLDGIVFGWELDPIILILWQRDWITLGFIKMYPQTSYGNNQGTGTMIVVLESIRILDSAKNNISTITAYINT